jgi:hypothetical protein
MALATINVYYNYVLERQINVNEEAKLRSTLSRLIKETKNLKGVVWIDVIKPNWGSERSLYFARTRKKKNAISLQK